MNPDPNSHKSREKARRPLRAAHRGEGSKKYSMAALRDQARNLAKRLNKGHFDQAGYDSRFALLAKDALELHGQTLAHAVVEMPESSPPMTRAQASAKGGKVTAADSPAKAASLSALHASLRGKRTNNSGLTAGQLRILLRDVSLAIAKGRASKRGLALAVKTSDRTLRRWLTGEDQPAALAVERLRTALRGLPGAKK